MSPVGFYAATFQGEQEQYSPPGFNQVEPQGIDRLKQKTHT
jgi:hypothetical protein